MKFLLLLPYHGPHGMFRAVGNSPLIYNDYLLWLHKRQSAVVIQRHLRGFLACILHEETMLTNAYDGSPSLLEDDSSASPSLLSISADATVNSNTKESEDAKATLRNPKQMTLLSHLCQPPNQYGIKAIISRKL